MHYLAIAIDKHLRWRIRCVELRERRHVRCSITQHRASGIHAVKDVVSSALHNSILPDYVSNMIYSSWSIVPACGKDIVQRVG